MYDQWCILVPIRRSRGKLARFLLLSYCTPAATGDASRRGRNSGADRVAAGGRTGPALPGAELFRLRHCRDHATGSHQPDRCQGTVGLAAAGVATFAKCPPGSSSRRLHVPATRSLRPRQTLAPRRPVGNQDWRPTVFRNRGYPSRPCVGRQNRESSNHSAWRGTAGQAGSFCDVPRPWANVTCAYHCRT